MSATSQSPDTNRPSRIFIIAGEASGDKLAAELLTQLTSRLAHENKNTPQCMGAGGKELEKLGVHILCDLPAHAVVGIIEPLKKIGFFKRVMSDLVNAAAEFQPDMVILVDYSGFNLRFAQKFLQHIQAPPYGDRPRPEMVYFISPQVWASRPKRAAILASHFDRLLSIFPFEKKWYSEHAPELRVEFIGHPIVDRYADWDWEKRPERLEGKVSPDAPHVVLLPGSRQGEVAHHWPTLFKSAQQLRQHGIVKSFSVIAANDRLKNQILSISPDCREYGIELVDSGLPENLMKADLAIASSGTVTMECAWFRVPTIVVYKTSWITFQIAKRIITVPHIAMPNILAGKMIFPELIQESLTCDNLVNEARKMLTEPPTRQKIFEELDNICMSLGEPGPCRRAAAILAASLDSHLGGEG